MPESSLFAFGIFYFDVGFRAHTAGSFLLHGQKKRTLNAGIKNQRKGRPATQISANYALIPLRFSPTLAHNQTRTKSVLKHGCA